MAIRMALITEDETHDEIETIITSGESLRMEFRSTFPKERFREWALKVEDGTHKVVIEPS